MFSGNGYGLTYNHDNHNLPTFGDDRNLTSNALEGPPSFESNLKNISAELSFL